MPRLTTNIAPMPRPVVDLRKGEQIRNKSLREDLRKGEQISNKSLREICDYQILNWNFPFIGIR
jgi:hypothetical protein